MVVVVSIGVARYQAACAAVELDSMCGGGLGCYLSPPTTDVVATLVVRDTTPMRRIGGCSYPEYRVEVAEVHYDAVAPETLPRRLDGFYTNDLSVGAAVTIRATSDTSIRGGDQVVAWLTYNDGGYPDEPWQMSFAYDETLTEVVVPVGGASAISREEVARVTDGAASVEARLDAAVDYTRRGTACFWASPRNDARGCDDFSYGYSGSPDVPDLPRPHREDAR